LPELVQHFGGGVRLLGHVRVIGVLFGPYHVRISIDLPVGGFSLEKRFSILTKVSKTFNEIERLLQTENT